MKEKAFTPTPINSKNKSKKLVWRVYPHTNFSKPEKYQLVWGFTLTELLIVVVIIGVLSVVVYPQYEGMRTRAGLRELYQTVEVIKAAENYYYDRKGMWRIFAWNDTDDAEEDLGITIKNDSFCTYWVSAANATLPGANPKYWIFVGVRSYYPTWAIYGYDLTHKVSYRNINHHYSQHITADADTTGIATP